MVAVSADLRIHIPCVCAFLPSTNEPHYIWELREGSVATSAHSLDGSGRIFQLTFQLQASSTATKHRRLNCLSISQAQRKPHSMYGIDDVMLKPHYADSHLTFSVKVISIQDQKLNKAV